MVLKRGGHIIVIAIKRKKEAHKPIICELLGFKYFSRGKAKPCPLF
jgi:hypothetical protein